MKKYLPQAAAPILEARSIRKAFSGVRALEDVSLELRAGEVHALMGENGAGKSTLMRVVAGLHLPDAGEILLRGRPVSIRSPHEAMRLGIAMIHQELMPIPDLTVAENVLLGHEPVSGVVGWIDRRKQREEARRLLGLLGADVSVGRRMRELSVAQMQTVEIAKALARDARIVIMDEPTAAISGHEVEALFRVIDTLTKQGVAIVYITHRMNEVFCIAQTVTVLRDGKHVETCPARDLDQQRLIGLMVGREWKSVFPAATDHAQSPAPSLGREGPRTGAEESLATEAGTAPGALAVRGLGRAGAFQDVSFEVRRGEILGLAGLMGAGRTEVVSALFGLMPADTGSIWVDGEPVRICCPADAMRYGIGMVTEDRKGYGLVPTMSVRQNITLASLRACCLGPLVRHGREAAVAAASIREFGIRTSGNRQAVGQLSGGNQQKVVIARALLPGPSIVILDEPARGIDVGAKMEVYGIIARLAREGKAVILVSSDLPEVLSLSHRLLVMRQGRVAAELIPARSTQEEVLKYAMPA
ncbi:MAG: sugar ABC transporter ATP-binding protein [Thermoguttaceae bacterium]|nr:sugar ABC transporter ATP-binding protein [Thermoguttaceae bacterium]